MIHRAFTRTEGDPFSFRAASGRWNPPGSGSSQHRPSTPPHAIHFRPCHLESNKSEGTPDRSQRGNQHSSSEPTAGPYHVCPSAVGLVRQRSLPESWTKAVVVCRCLFERNGPPAAQGAMLASMYSPLIAIVGMWGNLRRTIESSSNPDIPGILKSVRMMSGRTSRRILRATNPSSAARTENPKLRTMAAVV